MQVLDDQTAPLVRTLCDLMVPGSARVAPEVYIDALLARMPDGDRAATLGAFTALAPPFMLVRALACEAFYSDFVAPGQAGPGAYEEIDFTIPLAARIKKDWS